MYPCRLRDDGSPLPSRERDRVRGNRQNLGRVSRLLTFPPKGEGTHKWSLKGSHPSEICCSQQNLSRQDPQDVAQLVHDPELPPPAREVAVVETRPGLFDHPRSVIK